MYCSTHVTFNCFLFIVVVVSSLSFKRNYSNLPLNFILFGCCKEQILQHVDIQFEYVMHFYMERIITGVLNCFLILWYAEKLVTLNVGSPL